MKERGIEQCYRFHFLGFRSPNGDGGRRRAGGATAGFWVQRRFLGFSRERRGSWFREKRERAEENFEREKRNFLGFFENEPKWGVGQLLGPFYLRPKRGVWRAGSSKVRASTRALA